MRAVTLWAMTLTTGVCVGNIYFNQPLLQQIQNDFGASLQALAWVPTLTQVGYAFGMLFVIPLGDMFERRRLIVVATLTGALALLCMAWAPSFAALVAASLLVGLTTMTPQLIIPFAAHVADPQKRGQVVGTVMSGLLMGILLARTVSGFVGAAFGWRIMFTAAAAVEIGFAAFLGQLLPVSVPTYAGRYRDLLASVVQIVRSQPVLREAAILGAMLFGAFSAFWATLIYLMQTPVFGLGERATGLFGLLGAAGALVAPWVGRLADRRDARHTTGVGLLITAAAFGVFLLSSTSLVGLSVGVLLMDVGVQSAHISNQSRIFALLPEARSRINTAYMFAYFSGGAMGSWLATWAWSQAAWTGVCCVGLGMLAVGGLAFMRPAYSR